LLPRLASGIITVESIQLMTVQTANYYDIVTRLPADAVVTFHGVSWEDYEELLRQVGEASGLRISFDDGALTVMTLGTEHEKYTRFLEKLLTVLSLRQRINILSFGGATMKKAKDRKGVEPDACFYVQRAEVLGNRVELDFDVDPPPDIVVEVDIHHDSSMKLGIYAALGVSEVWRYEGEEVSIFLLEDSEYVQAMRSKALPVLTSQILTEFLRRLKSEGELQALLAFDQWLQAQQP
jgi:Uma2 family endonuclease